ncbi:hypothetical protein VPH35_104226 [Triticum aestivum]
MAGEEASEHGEEGIRGEPRGKRSDRGESEAWGRGPRHPGPYPLVATVTGSMPDAARVGATGEEGDRWRKRQGGALCHLFFYILLTFMFSFIFKKQNCFIKPNLALKIPF